MLQSDGRVSTSYSHLSASAYLCAYPRLQRLRATLDGPVTLGSCPPHRAGMFAVVSSACSRQKRNKGDDADV